MIVQKDGEKKKASCKTATYIPRYSYTMLANKNKCNQTSRPKILSDPCNDLHYCS